MKRQKQAGAAATPSDLLRRHLTEVDPKLREVDALVQRLCDASLRGDIEREYEALSRLGPVADSAH